MTRSMCDKRSPGNVYGKGTDFMCRGSVDVSCEGVEEVQVLMSW